MENTLFIILKHLHSLMRWALLGSLLVTLLVSLFNMVRRNGLSRNGIIAARTALITAHLQLLAGLVLYGISPKVVFNASSMESPILRFYLVEHVLLMLLGVTLITRGYLRMKKVLGSAAASRRIFWYYLTALILLLAGIPWPFMDYGGGWY